MRVWFVCQERLESLVFGLLRQRKLDFLDIYSDEIMAAAKAVVAQVTRRGESAQTRAPDAKSDVLLVSECRRESRARGRNRH